MITIHLFPALYGDTILLDIIEEENQCNTNILIDCGFNFDSHILPLLKKYNAEGKVIDRFIITHFDDDHIRSAAKFIKENGLASNPKIIEIRQVWLNTYRHIQFEKQQQPPADKKQIELLENFIAIQNPYNGKNETAIGAKQASLLGKELYGGKYPWNKDFEERAACIEYKNHISLTNNVIIKLLGPNREQLAALDEEFKRGLKEMGIVLSETELNDDAFELYTRNQSKQTTKVSEGPVAGVAIEKITVAVIDFLTSKYKNKPDSAPGNGSSIAFVLEADKKKILMLADAHAEPIIEQLKTFYPDQSTIFFDAIKVAHHGSLSNNPKALYELIDSPIYMISTNGEHPSHVHPDLETIAFIINRPTNKEIESRKLVFNYYPTHLTGLFDPELMEHYRYTIEVLNLIELA